MQGDFSSEIMEDQTERVKKLWLTPSFEGSFSGYLFVNLKKHYLTLIFLGAIVFQAALEANGINISEKKVRDILKTIPEYLKNVQKKTNFPRRRYTVHGYGQLLQVDIAVMKPTNGFKYFILAVDFYTQYIWIAALVDRRAETIKPFLKHILDKVPYARIEFDKG